MPRSILSVIYKYLAYATHAVQTPFSGGKLFYMMMYNTICTGLLLKKMDHYRYFSDIPCLKI